MRLGNLTLDAPFYQAGLAGYSDAAMRLIARRHGAPYCVTEAMLDQFLLHGGKGLKAAELDDEDHPICGQLMGSHPADIAAAAKVLVGLGYDVVDVNLACPVKKIRKKARGGHLLSEPDEAIAILDAVRNAVAGDVPVTCKLRRGYDDTPASTAGFYRIFEAAMELGLAGATVHSRTVDQKYNGPGRRPFLRQLAERYALGRYATARGPRLEADPHRATSAAASDEVTPTPAVHPRQFCLAGSGDVWTAADIFRMLDDTGVDGVSVARGCIGNPWVFTQAREYLAGDPLALTRPPTVHQQRDVLLEHLELSVRLHGDRQASKMMRKFGIRFARHHPDPDAVKADFIACQCLDDWQGVIAARYAENAPGNAVDDAVPEEARTQRDASTCMAGA